MSLESVGGVSAGQGERVRGARFSRCLLQCIIGGKLPLCDVLQSTGLPLSLSKPMRPLSTVGFVCAPGMPQSPKLRAAIRIPSRNTSSSAKGADPQTVFILLPRPGWPTKLCRALSDLSILLDSFDERLQKYSATIGCGQRCSGQSLTPRHRTGFRRAQLAFFVTGFFLAAGFLRRFPFLAAFSSIRDTAASIVTSSGSVPLGRVALIFSHFT